MRRPVLAALLVVSLAVVGGIYSLSTAHASNLEIGFGPGTPPGTMTLGGVTGSTSWSGDNWTMTVAGQTFATGTLNPVTGQTTVTSMPGFAACQAGCTTILNPTTLTGTLSITNHGAFVSAVAHWGGAHAAALTAAGMTVGSLVSSAARGSAHPTGGSTAGAASTTTHGGNKSSGAGGGPGNATSSGHATGAGAAHGGSGGAHGGTGTLEGTSASAHGLDAGTGGNGGGHGDGAGHGR